MKWKSWREMSEATILTQEWETIITELLEEQASTMDFLETMEEEEEDSQGVEKTTMVLDKQTGILDKQVGLKGAVKITGGFEVRTH